MRIILAIFFSATLFATVASAQKTTPKTTSDPVANLKTKQDSIQYALGVYMGNYLIRGGFSTLNLDLFLIGLNDVYKKKPTKINDSAAYAMLAGYQDEYAVRRNKFLEEQLFEVLKSKPGVGKLPSGVQFLVINPGKGPKPQETDTVVIHYKGTLATGEVFENTFTANASIRTTPGSLIPGLNEILQLMPLGATYEAFIPSNLGYGAKGNGRIPPNSALLVTVELVSIKNNR